MENIKQHRRELKHIPVNLPRRGFPGEHIYLMLWTQYLNANKDALTSIFGDLGEPLDQRGARVAASFMVWMGCNAGYSFTFSAERLAREMPVQRSDAFIAAWAIDNQRIYGTSDNVIMSEVMLTPGGIAYTSNGYTRRINHTKMYKPTQYDNDVINCMVKWWATRPATEMREIATDLIAAEVKKLQSQYFKEN